MAKSVANGYTNRKRNLLSGRNQGSKGGTPFVASMRESMVRGFQRAAYALGASHRHTVAMGSREERRLLSRRSNCGSWSGWVSGGAGTPAPERIKRRTFGWRNNTRCRRCAMHGGCNGGAQQPPCQDGGVLPRTSCEARKPGWATMDDAGTVLSLGSAGLSCTAQMELPVPTLRTMVVPIQAMVVPLRTHEHHLPIWKVMHGAYDDVSPDGQRRPRWSSA